MNYSFSDKTSPESKPALGIMDMPNEVLLYILKHLDVLMDYFKMAKVSTFFNKFVNDISNCKIIERHYFGVVHNPISYIMENSLIRLCLIWEQKWGRTFPIFTNELLVEYPRPIDNIPLEYTQDDKKGLLKVPQEVFLEAMMFDALRHGCYQLFHKIFHKVSPKSLNKWYRMNDELGKTLSPLFLVAEKGSIEMIKFMIDNGVDIKQMSPIDESYVIHVVSHADDKQNNIDTLSFLVEKGIHIDTPRGDGATGLYMAARYGKENMVKAFLKLGANPNAERMDHVTPLYVAIYLGHEEVVKVLLEDKRTDIHHIIRNDKHNTTTEYLFEATHLGFHSIMKLLLDKGINVNAKNVDGVTPAHIAALKGDLVALDILRSYKADLEIADNEGITVLMAAIRGIQPKILKKLIKYGVSVRTRSNNFSSPLFLAVKCNSLECVNILLERGLRTEELINGNIVVSYPGIDTPKDNGVTPLNAASESGNIEIVKRLLKAKADPNIAENVHGVTPIMIASQHGHIDIVKELIKYNANIRVFSNDMTSALYLACQQGHFEIVKILIESLEKTLSTKDVLDYIEAPRENQERTLHACVFRGHNVIVDYLLEKRVNVNLCRNDGVSPLLLAVHTLDVSKVVKLLRCGADPNKVKVNTNTSPLIYVSHREPEYEIGAILLAYGANPDIIDSNNEKACDVVRNKGKSWGKLLTKALEYRAKMESESVVGVLPALRFNREDANEK